MKRGGAAKRAPVPLQCITTRSLIAILANTESSQHPSLFPSNSLFLLFVYCFCGCFLLRVEIKSPFDKSLPSNDIVCNDSIHSHFLYLLLEEMKIGIGLPPSPDF